MRDILQVEYLNLGEVLDFCEYNNKLYILSTYNLTQNKVTVYEDNTSFLVAGANGFGFVLNGATSGIAVNSSYIYVAIYGAFPSGYLTIYKYSHAGSFVDNSDVIPGLYANFSCSPSYLMYQTQYNTGAGISAKLSILDKDDYSEVYSAGGVFGGAGHTNLTGHFCISDTYAYFSGQAAATAGKVARIPLADIGSIPDTLPALPDIIYDIGPWCTTKISLVNSQLVFGDSNDDIHIISLTGSLVSKETSYYPFGDYLTHQYLSPLRVIKSGSYYYALVGGRQLKKIDPGKLESFCPSADYSILTKFNKYVVDDYEEISGTVDANYPPLDALDGLPIVDRQLYEILGRVRPLYASLEKPGSPEPYGNVGYVAASFLEFVADTGLSRLDYGATINYDDFYDTFGIMFTIEDFGESFYNPDRLIYDIHIWELKEIIEAIRPLGVW